MPRLLLCGFGAFPAAPFNPAGVVVETLSAQDWRPAAGQADYLVLPVIWEEAFTVLSRRLRADPFDGVLILGVAVGSDAFRIERQARNHAVTTKPDHAGRLSDSRQILFGGQEILPVTAPCEAMHAALVDVGLPVVLSDDAGAYLCNFTLYRLLAGSRLPSGFLHVPQARECDPDARFELADLERAVKAAVEAFATDLAVQAADGEQAQRAG